MSVTRITERDLELLGFIAEHRLVLPGHVASLLDVSVRAANTRLRALASTGCLRQETIFHHQPSCYQITRKGLGAIDSGYRQPRIDLRCYRHDVGVAWLWLAARRGAFGPLRELVSERRLRSLDASPDGSGAEPAGVRLGGFGAAGRPRIHYPDLMLVLADGRRVALELELTGKGRTRREKILSGYAVDPRIDRVLYLVENPVTGAAIRSSARRIGIPDLVQVERVRWAAPAPASGPAPALGPAPAPALGPAPVGRAPVGGRPDAVRGDARRPSEMALEAL